MKSLWNGPSHHDVISALEVRGRPRREAAGRRKSECKVSLLSRNSSRSNGRRWMTRKRTTWHMDLRQLTVCYIRAVWVDQYARCNFFVCGPKFITWTENFGEIIPTSPISPEVIDVPTLNFKPSFKFSRLIFLVGPPSQFGCALGNLGQSLARVKISGRSPP